MDYLDDYPNPLAEAAAIALRVRALVAGRPDLLIQSDTLRNQAVDLVCWEYVPGQVWVWQFLYEGDVDEVVEQEWPPQEAMSAAARDPLSANLEVVAGPSIAGLGLATVQTGSNAADLSQLVTVYDGDIPGLQLYGTKYVDMDSPGATEHLNAMNSAIDTASDRNSAVKHARKRMSGL
jgi:hypothetical protein